MAYMNRDDRRAGIVEAAVGIIVRDGLRAATVRGVAQAIGGSPGHIHRHFASADELRAEAFRTLWADMAPTFMKALAGLPPRERLLAALAGDDGDIEPMAERLWRESLLATREDEHVRTAVREAMGQWLSLVVEIIEEGQAGGVFRTAPPSGEVARQLVALSVGIDLLSDLGLPSHAPDDVRTRVAACVDALLGPID